MVEVLTWGLALFAGGGLLVLERRCLGQMVVVQPLVICLVAGWLAGDETLGLWLGVTLQLFSVGQARRFDWAMIGVVAGAGQMASAAWGVSLLPGGAGALALTAVALVAGMLSRGIDRRYARSDGARQRARSPWSEANPAGAIEKLVRGVVARWFLVGGGQVVVATALAVGAAAAVDRLIGADATRNGLIAAALTAAGAGVALGSLSGYRLVLLAGASVALSWVALTLVVPG